MKKSIFCICLVLINRNLVGMYSVKNIKSKILNQHELYKILEVKKLQKDIRLFKKKIEKRYNKVREMHEDAQKNNPNYAQCLDHASKKLYFYKKQYADTKIQLIHILSSSKKFRKQKDIYKTLQKKD